MSNNKYICNHVQAMQAYTPGEQPSSPNVIKLNTNENPYPPSPLIAGVLHKFDPMQLRLYPDPLFMELRRKIALRHNCGVDQVFVGNGSDEILALCTRAFVENTGSIGYFEPSYSLYPVLTDIRGVEKRPVATATDFTWNMLPDFHASLFFMTNPNAPTSMLFDPQQVAHFCQTFAGVVVIDEAYVDFADQNCMKLALCPNNTNTMVMRTLSKSFSLAGLRLGYIVGPAPLVAALYKIKDSYNMDMLTQLVGIAALSDLDHMQTNVKRIICTRQKLSDTLQARGWQVCPSQTNFVFAKPSTQAAAQIFQQLKKDGIFVRYFPGPLTGEYLRITVGTDQQTQTLLNHPAMQ